MDSPDPSQQRVSHAERQQVTDALQRAAGDGRLEVDELEERLEAAWSAKTYADLVPILADLPDAAPAPPGAAPAARGGATPARAGRHGGQAGDLAATAVPYESSVAVCWEVRRTGVWRVEGTHTATAALGSVTLDLREAVFAERETVITANAVLGAVEIFVDSETAVIVDGTAIMGEFAPLKEKVPAELHDDSPVVRVTGTSVLGDVSVYRKRMPGEKKRKKR